MGMYTEIFFRAEVDEYAFTTLRSLSEGRRPGDDPHPLWLDGRGRRIRGRTAPESRWARMSRSGPLTLASELS